MPPFVRATIQHGTLTLNPWTPGLIDGGPMGMVLDGARSALADLVVIAEGEELIVQPVPRARWDADDEDAVLAWAAAVGYRRVWLPSRVVEPSALAESVRAGVTCPTCGLRWEDETPEFWASVREDGHFPGWCRACGGSLPEWSFVTGSELCRPPGG